MVSNQHIPEHELRQIVGDQPTTTPQADIETHISQCQTCQDRLLGLAADADWRRELSDGLAELSTQSSMRHSTSELQRKARSGDAFDLRTVDQMLNEVLQPPTHPETLGRLGRYEVESVIGCGGMGVVLRGFDAELHRPVAIKMVLPRLSTNGTAKQRFLREARAAAAVLHPNVIAIHDISESNDVPWFVMPLVAGPTLKSLVQRRGPLPEREIVRIGLQIASGLHAAHSQGLVHRDIKPENILVDNQVNRVIITDFGLARRETEESFTQTGILAGTPSYMSPEQAHGEELDSRSDLFSLGSLLFFLATGNEPFRAKGAMATIRKIGQDPHANVQALNPEISATFRRVIDRLLEKDPGQRFQTAGELETFLSQYLSHLNQPAKNPLPMINPAAGRSRRIRSVPVALGFIGAAIAGFLIWSSLPPTQPDGRKSLPSAGNEHGPVSISNPASPLASGRETSDPHPVLNWEDIKQKHRLSNADRFEQDLRELTNQVNGLAQAMQFQGDSLGSESLSRTEENLPRDLRRISQEIESLGGRLDSGL